MSSFWMGVLEQGFLFSIMVYGVYITYKILDFPDLSVDGTFPLGAAVTAFFLIRGVNPVLTCLLSFLAGMAAGFITGVLNVKFKITNLLSGILVMIGLYSINLRIMGKANTPLFSIKTIFSVNINPIFVIIFLSFLVKLLLDLLFKTKFGFILKATGDNSKMVTTLGIDIGTVKIIGVMLSNGLVALAGSVMAQYQRFSDVGMGSGIIVMGLASIIMGETVLKASPIRTGTLCALIGSVFYKGSIAIALKAGLPPTDLKLMTSIIVITALAIYNKGFKVRLGKKPLFGGVRTASYTKSA